MGMEVGAVWIAEPRKCRRPNFYKEEWTWPWGPRSQPRGWVEADVAAVCAGPNFYDVEWAWRLVQSGLRKHGSAGDPIFTRKKGPAQVWAPLRVQRVGGGGVY